MDMEDADDARDLLQSGAMGPVEKSLEKSIEWEGDELQDNESRYVK